MVGYVYKLVCPIKNEPIYVGSTKSNIKGRLTNHISCISKSESPIYKYLRENNIRPRIELLETVVFLPEDYRRLSEVESKWIKTLSDCGYALFNVKKIILPNGGLPYLIRIAKPSKKVYQTVTKLAEKEGRTIAAQANYMLEKYIEQSTK
jgi:hypothetical protein